MAPTARWRRVHDLRERGDRTRTRAGLRGIQRRRARLLLDAICRARRLGLSCAQRCAMTIVALEVLGLLAVSVALSVVWRSAGFQRHKARTSLSVLLLLLAFNHLANVLEARGAAWADS